MAHAIYNIVRGLDQHSAGSISGLLNSDLTPSVRQVNAVEWAGRLGLSKFALQDYPKIYGLVRLVYKIATNQINAGGHCWKSLRATKLVLIAKKPSGIRPIAVGETLRRIAGRFVTRWHKDKIITALGPHQYAMQSNGTTKLVRAARNTLEKHHDFAMLAPDAKMHSTPRADSRA